tara:strand:+ start:79 stop:276 length:198 start_codon:yes stop_codon:yes gene_type:complete
MEKFHYNLISVILFWVSLGWVVYTIFSSWQTTCFDLTKTYFTVIILLASNIWNGFIRPTRIEVKR